MTNWKICDICCKKDFSGKGEKWTEVNLGIKLIAYPDIHDVCPDCTSWLIDKVNERRMAT